MERSRQHFSNPSLLLGAPRLLCGKTPPKPKVFRGCALYGIHTRVKLLCCCSAVSRGVVTMPCSVVVVSCCVGRASGHRESRTARALPRTKTERSTWGPTRLACTTGRVRSFLLSFLLIRPAPGAAVATVFQNVSIKRSCE